MLKMWSYVNNAERTRPVPTPELLRLCVGGDGGALEQRAEYREVGEVGGVERERACEPGRGDEQVDRAGASRLQSG
jgi:hypothetical protein